MSTDLYNGLDPQELEAAVARDLAAALEKRGAQVRHDGRSGRPDVVVTTKNFAIVVEVASRSGADAASEYLAIRDHRDLIEFETSKTTHLLFSCWATPDRIIRAMREENASRAVAGRAGRSLFLDLRSLGFVLARLAVTSADVHPIDRLSRWFGAWDEIGDDVTALEKLNELVFDEDRPMDDLVAAYVERRTQLEQEALRKDVRRLEDLLRHRNVTRNDAMRVLVYVMFAKLYEEKREANGQANRFTKDGFARYRSGLSARARQEYAGRTLEHLLENEIAIDPDVRAAGLLEDPQLPRPVNDDFVLNRVLPALDRYRFRGTHLDALGAVFEALARRAEKDTRIGQFFTPEPIVRFAVDVGRPGPTETVLDPAAGTGRFLTFSMERMRARADQVQGTPAADVISAIHAHRLLGTDADPWIVTIAKMNMYIHGDGKSNIRHENGLFLGDLSVFPRREGTLRNEVDLCLTNPPLGDMSYQAYAADLVGREGSPVRDSDEWLSSRLPLLPGAFAEERIILDADRRIDDWRERYRQAVQERNEREERKAERYITYHQERRATAEAALRGSAGTYVVAGTTAKGGALFLAAIKDYLRAVRDPAAVEEWRGGRVGIIVDEAILNTPLYAQTRRFIRRHYFVKAVFSFSRDAFWYQARTTAKTSLLFLYRKPDPAVAQREPIFMCHVERIGFTRTGRPDENQLPEVLEAYLAFEEAIRDSYRGHHFDENAARARVEETSFPAAVRVRWEPPPEPHWGDRLDYAFEAARQIRALLPEHHRTLGYYAESVQRHPVEDPLRIYAFATVDRRTGEVRPKEVTDTSYTPHELLKIAPGDIVLSGMDLVYGAAGCAREEVADLVVSREFYTLRVRPEREQEIDPRYLALFLRTPQARALVAGLVTGTSNRTRIEDEASLMDVPLPDLPPIDEQREIADRLDAALDERRAARRALRTALEDATRPWLEASSETVESRA